MLRPSMMKIKNISHTIEKKGCKIARHCLKIDKYSDVIPKENTMYSINLYCAIDEGFNGAPFGFI